MRDLRSEAIDAFIVKADGINVKCRFLLCQELTSPVIYGMILALPEKSVGH